MEAFSLPVSHQPPDRVQLELARGEAGGQPVALLTVADNGPGVPDELVERIFRRGVSTKQSSPDTPRGIGLDLVRRTVEHHGGTVRVFQDDGAVFEISLPLTAHDGAGLVSAHPGEDES